MVISVVLWVEIMVRVGVMQEEQRKRQEEEERRQEEERRRLQQAEEEERRKIEREKEVCSICISIEFNISLISTIRVTQLIQLLLPLILAPKANFKNQSGHLSLMIIVFARSYVSITLRLCLTNRQPTVPTRCPPSASGVQTAT